MDLDFMADLQEICREKIGELNYTLRPNEDPVSLWFNYHNRQILPYPRIIHKSAGFACPRSYEQALSDILQDAQDGLSLRRYQSRLVSKPDEHDLMLYDWGIYHFHLRKRNPRIIEKERTCHLLFALVRPRDFYCISIGKHGDWSKIDFLETIHANWPYITKCYIVNNIHNEIVLTAEQRERLRKKHLNSFVRLSTGETVAPLGGGFMCNGESLDSHVQYMYINKYLKLLEQETLSEVFLHEINVKIEPLKIVDPHWRLVEFSFPSCCFTIYDDVSGVVVTNRQGA